MSGGGTEKETERQREREREKENEPQAGSVLPAQSPHTGLRLMEL